MKRNILKLLFIIYCAIMLVLLFNRPKRVFMDYWEQVRLSTNLVPFKTIMGYLGRWSSFAVINLFGNIITFVPLGFFLPLFWQRMRSFKWFLPCCALIICTVELTQLFTLRGSCDIDDLILNLMGISIGFVLFRIRKTKEITG